MGCKWGGELRLALEVLHYTGLLAWLNVTIATDFNYKENLLVEHLTQWGLGPGVEVIAFVPGLAPPQLNITAFSRCMAMLLGNHRTTKHCFYRELLWRYDYTMFLDNDVQLWSPAHVSQWFEMLDQGWDFLAGYECCGRLTWDDLYGFKVSEGMFMHGWEPNGGIWVYRSSTALKHVFDLLHSEVVSNVTKWTMAPADQGPLLLALGRGGGVKHLPLPPNMHIRSHAFEYMMPGMQFLDSSSPWYVDPWRYLPQPVMRRDYDHVIPGLWASDLRVLEGLGLQDSYYARKVKIAMVEKNPVPAKGLVIDCFTYTYHDRYEKCGHGHEKLKNGPVTRYTATGLGYAL
jgi:hypothetical protein